MFTILGKRRGLLPLRFYKFYHIRRNLRGFNQSCDIRLYEWLKKKMYFAKNSNASYETKKDCRNM